MSRWEGFSPRLQSQDDLLAKLRRDLARLEANPNDDDAAWNFFVTADHMRDWEQARGRPKREPDVELLRIVWDLSSHGKHFRTYPAVASVDGVTQRGVFAPGVFDPRVFNTVRLTLEIIDPPGTISAVALARQVVDWWAVELATGSLPVDQPAP